ncbi:MAG: hypothetical protein Q9169_006833 [Polycauliona sp. 2 TL-2023]
MGANDMINEVAVILETIRDFAGDNMVALELNLLKATAHFPSITSTSEPPDTEVNQTLESASSHQSTPSPSPPDTDVNKSLEPASSHHSMPSPPNTPPVTTAQEELIQRRLSRMKTPDINIKIPDGDFRNSTLVGMHKSELKQRLEEDMLDRGIHAPIQDCAFRGKWIFIFVRCFDLEITAKVRVLWKPSMFGHNAFLKTTINAGLPPFLNPADEAKFVRKRIHKIPPSAPSFKSREAREARQAAREIFINMTDQRCVDRFSNLKKGKLKRKLVHEDLKAQGLHISIAGCKMVRSKKSACLRIRTATPEEAIQLKQAPNWIPKIFGEGARLVAGFEG